MSSGQVLITYLGNDGNAVEYLRRACDYLYLHASLVSQIVVATYDVVVHGWL